MDDKDFPKCKLPDFEKTEQFSGFGVVAQPIKFLDLLGIETAEFRIVEGCILIFDGEPKNENTSLMYIACYNR